MDILSLTSDQLIRAAKLKEKISAFEQKINHILAGGGGNGVPSPLMRQRRRGMSAAGRARIAAAQRARWAKVNASRKPVRKSKRTLSAAAKSKIAAAAKARWAKAKAAGKNSL